MKIKHIGPRKFLETKLNWGREFAIIFGSSLLQKSALNFFQQMQYHYHRTLEYTTTYQPKRELLTVDKVEAEGSPSL